MFDSEIAFRRALFNRDTADRPAVTFHGRVVDTEGKRVDGARAVLWVSWRNQLASLVDQTTARDGGFHLPLRVGPWTYVLRISHPGLATEIVEKLPLDRRDRASSVAAPRTFRLAPEHVIRGRVVDRAGGEPVEGARVLAFRGAEDVIEVGEATTATDGSFALGGLEGRRYFLRVAKFGWRTGGSKNAVTAPTARATIKVRRANVMRGTVRSADGQLEPNATVLAVLSGVPGGPTPLDVWTTDDQGAFQQDHFAPGTYYVWARRGNMLLYPPEKIDLAVSQEADVVITLNHEGARVSGRVRAREGYELGPQSRAVLVGRSPLAFPRAAVGELAPGGSFTITGVLPGRYEITIRDGERTLSVMKGPREVEVPIDPDSEVLLKETLMVRPQMVD